MISISDRYDSDQSYEPCTTIKSGSIAVKLNYRMHPLLCGGHIR